LYERGLLGKRGFSKAWKNFGEIFQCVEIFPFPFPMFGIAPRLGGRFVSPEGCATKRNCSGALCAPTAAILSGEV
jgi:hypothetical protein